MKIGNLKTSNQSFGVKIDSFINNGMLETAKNIAEKNGRNSEEYKQLIEDVKVITEKYPETSLFYDMYYDVRRVSIWLRLDNPVSNMKCLGFLNKDEMFSQYGIHYIAGKINALSGGKH